RPDPATRQRGADTDDDGNEHEDERTRATRGRFVLSHATVASGNNTGLRSAIGAATLYSRTRTGLQGPKPAGEGHMAKRALCWVGILLVTTGAAARADWWQAPVVGADVG